MIGLMNERWTYTYGGAIDVASQSEIPIEFALNQNYPNPFNPTTTISFTISKSSNVNLQIFDVLGNKINTIINEQLTPGYYKANFDASNLSSGIYFYKLETDYVTITKKCLLIK